MQKLNASAEGQVHMGFSGLGRTKWVVSHQDSLEMLLIRTAHHLWKWEKLAARRREGQLEKIYGLAWVSVIEAKEAFRKPRRESRIRNLEAFRVKAAERVARAKA